MSIRSRRLRWAVPAMVSVTVAAAAGVAALSAAAAPQLPAKSAEQLLVDVQKAAGTALSGTVVQSASLGLPALPSTSGRHGATSFTDLVSGSHTLRVWVDGRDRTRVALMGTLGESDLIRNGSQLWLWNSSDNTATRYTLPAAADGTRPGGTGHGALPSPLPSPLPSAMPTTPQQAAQEFLALIGKSTQVSTDGTATVAGRAAYELILAPKDHNSLIGQVRLAIDSTTSVPLRVQVIPRGSTTPAFEVGFTQISFATPNPAQFTFTPPPGTTVTTGDGHGGQHPGTAPGTHPASGDHPTVVGSGWTAVVVGTIPPQARSNQGGGTLTALLKELPAVPGRPGARMLTGTLFTVVVDHDTVAVGAVPPTQVLQALGQR